MRAALVVVMAGWLAWPGPGVFAQSAAAPALPPEAAVFDAMRREELRRHDEILAKGVAQADSRQLDHVVGRLLHLGGVARFQLGRPRDALELYTAAEKLGSRVGAFAAADTLQWELDDRNAAAARWHRLAEAFRIDTFKGGPDAPLAKWMVGWLDAQVAWLETGRRFEGTIGGAELATGFVTASAVGAELASGHSSIEAMQNRLPQKWQRANPPPIDHASIARDVAGLPPSSTMLAAGAWFLQYMPDADGILAFARKHDSSGYASAWYFGMVGESDHGRAAYELFPALAKDASPDHPLRVAARRYLEANRIDVRPIDRTGR